MFRLFTSLVFAICSTICFASPQRVIFDTDMGNDIDDALALAMLYAYQSDGKADVAAVLINKDNCYSPVFVNIMNNYYGFGGIPLGMVESGVTPKEGAYIGKIAELKNWDGSYKYARTVGKETKLVDAVKLARKVLAESADGEVVYISVGFSTNIARLLESKPDEISPLSGMELVSKKVKYFSVMAGNFAGASASKKGPREYNVINDIKPAAKFFSNSPVPIVFSGFEVGNILLYPQSALDENMAKDNPVRAAYELYVKMLNKGKSDRRDQPTWDLTSVLYVFNPEFFDLSEKGFVSVDDKGMTMFTPSSDALHRYVKIPENGAKKIIDKLVERSTSLKPAK